MGNMQLRIQQKTQSQESQKNVSWGFDKYDNCDKKEDRMPCDVFTPDLNVQNVITERKVKEMIWRAQIVRAVGMILTKKEQ